MYLLRCTDGSLVGRPIPSADLRAIEPGTASRYTASRLPVELSHAIPMPDPTAARRDQARVKRLSRADRLAWLSAAHDRNVMVSRPLSIGDRELGRPALGADERTHRRRRRLPPQPHPIHHTRLAGTREPPRHVRDSVDLRSGLGGFEDSLSGEANPSARTSRR